MEHLIDILQLTTQEIDDMVATANDIIDHPDAYAHKCDGKILATLFFEPSTRQGAGLLVRKQLFRRQGRERFRHGAHRQLLC